MVYNYILTQIVVLALCCIHESFGRSCNDICSRINIHWKASSVGDENPPTSYCLDGCLHATSLKASTNHQQLQLPNISAMHPIWRHACMTYCDDTYKLNAEHRSTFGAAARRNQQCKAGCRHQPDFEIETEQQQKHSSRTKRDASRLVSYAAYVALVLLALLAFVWCASISMRHQHQLGIAPKDLDNEHQPLSDGKREFLVVTPRTSDGCGGGAYFYPTVAHQVGQIV